MTKFGFSTFFFAICMIASTCAGGMVGNCDDNFLNMDRFDMCEGGIEAVVLGSDGESVPCSIVDKGACSPYDCCEKVAMGNCVDNFLYMDKEYLCHGGTTGVINTSCRIASDGSCDSVDCCDDWESDFSFYYSYSFME